MMLSRISLVQAKVNLVGHSSVLGTNYFKRHFLQEVSPDISQAGLISLKTYQYSFIGVPWHHWLKVRNQVLFSYTSSVSPVPSTHRTSN